MDKTTTGQDNLYHELEPPKKGQDNLYYELEPPKKIPQAGIYDDVAEETAIPATKPISYKENTRGATKKSKRATLSTSQSDTVLIRRLVFISTAVVVVAFLTAAATLILALSLIMSRNDNTGAKDLKDCGAIYGK